MKTISVLTGVVLSLAALAQAPIPDKTVVLTFDDAVKSHRSVVAPMLAEYGFGATFFVTQCWMNDPEYFMSWGEVAEIHAMGFEIGNHTWTHGGLSMPAAAAHLAGELALVESALKKAGVPKPVSFAWPGNRFGPEGLAVLEAAGYKLARRGMQPEIAYGTNVPGPLYVPSQYHALLLPTAGDAYPDWTLDHFKRVVDRARDGQIAIVQFHGVPDERHPWVHTPPERFREYMDYLKAGGFNVIAMRDLLPFLPEQPVESDPMLQVRYSAGGPGRYFWPVEVRQTRDRLDFWLENMVTRHGYNLEEVLRVTALPEDDVKPRLAQLPAAAPRRGVQVLPYPGGRHPRIGFLEGAVDPMRGTKASIFPPWENGGYVVLDVPEAIFANDALMFLAHTHVPTIWNAQNIVIENVDWIVHDDGSLSLDWPLPNGVRFGAGLRPEGNGVDVTLWLENSGAETLSGLRTQVCLMLKEAPGFAAQSNDAKRFESPVSVVKAEGADRYILKAFERCGRAWGNARCPCMHADPVLPDAAPGARVSVKGRVWFYEGTDIDAEIARATQAFAAEGR